MMLSDGTRPDRAVEHVGLPGICVWFGVVAGLAEVGALLAERHLGGRFIWVSRDFVWMTPLAYVIFFTPVALLLWIATRRTSTRARLRIVATSFAFLTTLSLLFLFGGLHRLAVGLLAAGLAVQIGRWVSDHPDLFSRLVRRSTPALLAVAVIAALGLRGRDFLQERRALADLPPAAAGAPNILLIILDTVRAQNMSLYGYERATTPHLERWAKRGIVFERAISTAPWTLPSHGTMFTGRYPHELEADWKRPLGDRFPTLAERLRARGYLTAGFVANFYYTTHESGLDRGFIHYQDHLTSLQQILLSSAIGQVLNDGWQRARGVSSRRDIPMAFLNGRIPPERQSHRKSARRITDEFLDWLGKHADLIPYLAFLNYFDAHKPYRTAARFAEKFGHRQDVDRYDASIAYLDAEVGRLLQELERDGRLRNTIVVVTSDHGELFGEHGLSGHGNSLYIQLLHVPLVIIPARAAPSGVRVPDPVSLRELPGTLLSMTGVGPMLETDGTTLERFWRANPPLDPAPDTLLAEVRQSLDTPPKQPTSHGDMKALIAGTLHYIRNGDGSEELYDWQNDPTEARNLISTVRGRKRAGRLRRALNDRIRHERTRVTRRVRR